MWPLDSTSQTYFTKEYQKAYLARFGGHTMAVKEMPNAPKIVVRPDSTIVVVRGKRNPWLAMAGALLSMVLIAIPLLWRWILRSRTRWRQQRDSRIAPDDEDCIMIT